MQIFSNIKALLQKTALWILLAPIAITFVGVASNQAVLIANHDKFPVMVNSTKLTEFEARANSLAPSLGESTHCPSLGNLQRQTT